METVNKHATPNRGGGGQPSPLAWRFHYGAICIIYNKRLA